MGVLSQICWLLCSEWPLTGCPAYHNWQQPWLHPGREAGWLPRLLLSGPSLEPAKAGNSTPRAETLQKQRLSHQDLSRLPRGRTLGRPLSESTVRGGHVGRERASAGKVETCSLVQILPFGSCVVLSKLLPLSELLFPHL